MKMWNINLSFHAFSFSSSSLLLRLIICTMTVHMVLFLCYILGQYDLIESCEKKILRRTICYINIVQLRFETQGTTFRHITAVKWFWITAYTDLVITCSVGHFETGYVLIDKLGLIVHFVKDIIFSHINWYTCIDTTWKYHVCTCAYLSLCAVIA